MIFSLLFSIFPQAKALRLLATAYVESDAVKYSDRALNAICIANSVRIFIDTSSEKAVNNCKYPIYVFLSKSYASNLLTRNMVSQLVCT